MPDDIAQLGLDIGELRKSVNEATKLIDGMGKQGKKTNDDIGILQSGISKLMAVFSVSTVVSWTKSLIDMGSALQDQSTALNVNVEAIQELNYAFSQSGADAADVTNSIIKLNQSLDAAREGNEKAIDSFEKLGLTWKDIATLSPEDALMAMAEGAKNAKDPVAALDAIVELLGRSGKKLAAGLREGADGIRALREESTKLTKDEVEKLDRIGDAWTRLINKAKVYGAELLLQLGKGPGGDSMKASAEAAVGFKNRSPSDLNKMFESAIPPHLKEASEDTPIDPRDAKASHDKEEAANDRAWKKRDEALKKNEQAEKRITDETLDKYQAIHKAREEANKADRKRREENQDINKDLERQAEVTDLSRKGNKTMAQDARIRAEYEKKIAEAIKDGNKEGEEMLRKEQNAKLAPLAVEDAKKTAAMRRGERAAGREVARDEAKAREQQSDLDDRIARGAKGDKGSRLEQRREQLDRIKRGEGRLDQERGKAPTEQQGYGSTDRQLLQKIANAFSETDT